MDDICRHKSLDVKESTETDIRGSKFMARTVYKYKCESVPGCGKSWTEYGDWTEVKD